MGSCVEHRDCGEDGEECVGWDMDVWIDLYHGNEIYMDQKYRFETSAGTVLIKARCVWEPWGGTWGYSFVKPQNFCHPNISFSYETKSVYHHSRKLPVVFHAAGLVIIPDLVSYHLVKGESVKRIFRWGCHWCLLYWLYCKYLSLGTIIIYWRIVYVYNLLIDFSLWHSLEKRCTDCIGELC